MVNGSLVAFGKCGQDTIGAVAMEEYLLEERGGKDGERPSYTFNGREVEEIARIYR
jgi:hypothetical protein